MTSLSDIKQQVENCTDCPLHKNRTNPVFGEGNEDTEIMFIGEAPGEQEDKTGRPFVGKAGKKLTEIIESVDLKREDFYTTNIVKARPPDNRDPKQEEIDACRDYLEAQIATINPELIITLGAVPTQDLLDTDKRISTLRGKFYDWRGVKIFPMFHPSYLLYNPSKEKGSPKWKTFEDIKKVRESYEKLMS